MPETAANKEALVSEAQTLIARLVAVKHKLAENECEFVISLDEKLRRYGYSAFVSPAQLKWLRILDKQHGVDPRQTSFLEP